jgi:DNA-directed RNA polymerase sigma subunit (sigma70/sigma32)
MTDLNIDEQIKAFLADIEARYSSEIKDTHDDPSDPSKQLVLLKYVMTRFPKAFEEYASKEKDEIAKALQSTTGATDETMAANIRYVAERALRYTEPGLPADLIEKIWRDVMAAQQ